MWSIERDGSRLTIVEPDGSTHVEDTSSVEMARVRFTILVNQRHRSGWTLVPPGAEPVAAAPVVENARNPELEAVLLDDPENVQAWLVYGDWLQQQNDPRGTYIVLRVAAPRDIGAARKLRKLEEQYGHYLHGGVLGRLWYGFVMQVSASKVDDIDRAFGTDAGRFITWLEVTASTTSLPAIIDALGRHDPRALRHLHIAGRARLETVSPIASVLARLHSLDLDCVVGRNCVTELSELAMPKLARLAVADSDIAPLLARADLDALVDLTAPARFLDTLLTSPIAKRLERLVLLGLDRAGAEHLVTHMARFWKLRELAIAVDTLPQRLVSELEARVGVVSRLSPRYVPITE